ncbi:high mobility group box domain-containing protein [Dichotomocladium elegans]|nr:high mobility group box domain-containing protein [Dichotomocladium elegans]
MQHDRTSQVQGFLADCNLLQYYRVFIDEGFDRLEALLEATEVDLEQMGVKRGHRRLIQRAIANCKKNPASTYIINSIVRDPGGKISSLILLINMRLLDNTPPPPPVIMSHHASVSSVSGAQSSGMSSTEDDTVTSENITRCWKRRYQRHATPDKNAPVKPPSAYVMFCNNLRTELKDQNLSFPAFAKIAGVQWKNLDAADKQFYERQAQRAKDEYRIALEQYQQTEEYKKYQQYLSDFREKHEAAGKTICGFCCTMEG